MFIDYKKLSDSVEFYEEYGFQRLEAPWWVPKEIMMLTAPPGRDADDLLYQINKNSKCLVASGEQSFLYMANQGMLPKGRFQAVTPCFRDEVQGPTRRKFFMKNELIMTDSTDKDALNWAVNAAFVFFSKQVPNEGLLQVVDIGDGSLDIEYDGIEIGSYGIRENALLKWVYATGCAEPRLTRAIAISQHKRSK